MAGHDNALTTRRNVIGSRSHRLVGFPKPGLASTVAVDPPSIAPGATGHVDVTVLGVRLGAAQRGRHVVVGLPPSGLESGLVALSTVCIADDTVRVTLANPSSTPVDGAERTWTMLLFTKAGT